jgi:hypothetical protein
MTQYFGYLSGIFIILSFLPYLISIFKGQTKPERASWLLWVILGGIAFSSQLAKGASASLWLPAFQTIGDIFILILSIKYGMGGLLKRDKVAFVVAGLSLILWYITREPIIALLLAILIDATGATLTAIKSYEHPTTESISAWVLTGFGGFFAIFAVGNWNWVLLLFPIYTFLANVAIVSSIKLGQRVVHKN